MSKRAKIIITIAILGVLALLVWLIVAGRRSALPATSAPSASPPLGGGTPPPSGGSFTPSATLRTGAPALDAFVRSFAERYGSFSNQSGFANLKELLPFMTEELRKESEKLVARATTANAPYAGTTTKALAIKEQQVGDSAATFLISTQRRESTAQNPNTKVYYQDLELSLLKIGEEWKVNRAVWK